VLPRPFNDDAIILQAIERIRMGDSDAFNVIFEGCHVVIQSLCRARLRWADRCIHYEDDLASEILTATWLTIRDRRTTWNSGADVWHAILRIAFERGINRAKYVNRSKRSTDLELATLFRQIHGHRNIAPEFEVINIEETFEHSRFINAPHPMCLATAVYPTLATTRIPELISSICRLGMEYSSQNSNILWRDCF